MGRVHFSGGSPTKSRCNAFCKGRKSHTSMLSPLKKGVSRKDVTSWE